MSGGIHPFNAATDTDVDRNIITDHSDFASVTDHVALDLVKAMLQDISPARPSAKSLLRYIHTVLNSVHGQ